MKTISQLPYCRLADTCVSFTASTKAASSSGMEFQRRDTDWPVYGTSTETCGTDLMTDIEDGGVDQMSMIQPANDAIAILDENIGSSVDCYDTSNCGIGINFVRIGGEDFRSDNWMSNATTKNDYHHVSDVANFETKQLKILADSSSMEYDTTDRYPGAHSYNASAGPMDSSPAQKSQAIETAVGADMNSEEDTSHAAFTEKYASSSSSSQGEVL